MKKTNSFLSILIILLLNVLKVHLSPSSTNVKKSLDIKSFGFNKNYDIWDDAPKKKERFFLDKTEINNDKLYGDVDIDGHKLIENNKNFTMRKSKVLNILAQPNEDECTSNDGLHTGVCLNVYECRIQGGRSKGDCALGFVIATCDEEIKNNITYFMSPKFPSLLPKDMTSCALKIMPVHPDISQIRLDFVHFALGQPNRRTGECDGDIMRLGGGVLENFFLCGENTGQHVYLDVNPKARDGGIVEVLMNFTSNAFNSRLWEIRVTQIPFSQRAPSGCLQYFTEPEGILKTFNFAENGRHLAGQNYKACFRQNPGTCSIAYEPCNEQSFRIGPSLLDDDSGGGGGGGLADSFGGIQAGLGENPAVLGDLQSAASDTQAIEQANPADNLISNDENTIEGSGDDGVDTGGIFSDFPGFSTFRDIFFSFRSMRSNKYHKMKTIADARQLYSTCTDRITMPCIIEDFIGVGMGEVPSCVPVHCGLSLCPPGISPCRLESSVTPFRLGIRFGSGARKGSPEDNIGACLRYFQMPCG
uniref:CSON000532 protein n=1 Tax=Culicoides sonorensis TaxID=179676 RepID=A0A336MSC2_CULSO